MMKSLILSFYEVFRLRFVLGVSIVIFSLFQFVFFSVYGVSQSVIANIDDDINQTFEFVWFSMDIDKYQSHQQMFTKDLFSFSYLYEKKDVTYKIHQEDISFDQINLHLFDLNEGPLKQRFSMREGLIWNISEKNALHIWISQGLSQMYDLTLNHTLDVVIHDEILTFEIHGIYANDDLSMVTSYEVLSDYLNYDRVSTLTNDVMKFIHLKSRYDLGFDVEENSFLIETTEHLVKTKHILTTILWMIAISFLILTTHLFYIFMSYNQNQMCLLRVLGYPKLKVFMTYLLIFSVLFIMSFGIAVGFTYYFEQMILKSYQDIFKLPFLSPIKLGFIGIYLGGMILYICLLAGFKMNMFKHKHIALLRGITYDL